MIKHKVSVRKEDQHTVHCDTCNEPTPQQNFETAGDAADHARVAGFTTKFSSNIAPATWHCQKHSS
jgi:hypothetical protein